MTHRSFEEPYWDLAAEQLRRVIESIPGLNPVEAGEGLQRFLASYNPPEGAWDERILALRDSFVSMGDKQFRSIYQTYLTNYHNR